MVEITYEKYAELLERISKIELGLSVLSCVLAFSCIALLFLGGYLVAKGIKNGD